MLRRLKIIAGCILFACLGRERFYLFMQGDGAFAALGRAFVEATDVQWIITNWQSARDDMNAKGRSPSSLRDYDGPELGGWAAIHQKHGDSYHPLPEQIRGMVIPVVAARIKEDADRIVEIGCGSGDVCAYLATMFPDVDVVGVDFSVEIAKRHTLSNLSFVEGYALDLMQAGRLRGDVVFGTSTFCVFTPNEMRRYASAIAQAGFSSVIVSDPLRHHAYRPDRFPGRSLHLTQGQWGHDFAHYFAPYGFKVAMLDFPIYTGHARSSSMPRQLVRLERVVFAPGGARNRNHFRNNLEVQLGR
jgi:SAM-dependent methyltransferase